MHAQANFFSSNEDHITLPIIMCESVSTGMEATRWPIRLQLNEDFYGSWGVRES